MMGYIEDGDKVIQLSSYPVLVGLNNTLDIARNVRNKEIYITITPEEDNQIYDLIHRSEKRCIQFKVIMLGKVNPFQLDSFLHCYFITLIMNKDKIEFVELKL